MSSSPKMSRSVRRNVSVSGADLIQALNKTLSVQLALITLVMDVVQAVMPPKDEPGGGIVFVVEDGD
jgi:hypothetical protein